MVEFRLATTAEVKSFCNTVPNGIREAWGAFDTSNGDIMLGVAIVLRDPLYVGSPFEDEADWYAIFELRSQSPGLGLRIILGFADHLKRFDGEPLYVWHDHRFPTAERLLRILGFQPTDQFRSYWEKGSPKMRIWKRWPESARS